MYVILAYDVNTKRVSKVLKICRRYLYHVQNSLFEGNITEAKLRALKKEIAKYIVPEQDSVTIYELNSARFCQKEQLGRVRDRACEKISVNSLL